MTEKNISANPSPETFSQFLEKKHHIMASNLLSACDQIFDSIIKEFDGQEVNLIDIQNYLTNEFCAMMISKFYNIYVEYIGHPYNFNDSALLKFSSIMTLKMLTMVNTVNEERDLNKDKYLEEYNIRVSERLKAEQEAVKEEKKRVKEERKDARLAKSQEKLDLEKPKPKKSKVKLNK